MSADARGGDAFSAPDDDSELRLHVVRYTDQPDRVTVSPRDVSAADYTTTWLSVDANAVVPLTDAR